MKDERPHTQLRPPNGSEGRLQELVRAQPMMQSNGPNCRITKWLPYAKVA